MASILAGLATAAATAKAVKELADKATGGKVSGTVSRITGGGSSREERETQGGGTATIRSTPTTNGYPDGPYTQKYTGGNAELDAKLAGRQGSYLAYNPQDTAAYFAVVWDRAVALCARLCRTYGLTADSILCHSEGYVKGIASNHADVMHWWPYHGKTMDMFRATVREALGGKSELYAAVDKLAGASIIINPAYWKGGAYSAANVQALIIKMAAAL